MTLTPREYLHQHFGPKDRKWIESLSDAECKYYAERYSDATEAPSRRWFKRPQRFEDLHPLPDVPIYPYGTKITHNPVTHEIEMLPDVPGEYENWR